MKIAKIIEEHSVSGAPLGQENGQTVVDYVKYDFSYKGTGFPVEFFNFYDPTRFSHGRLMSHKGGYIASIDVLKNQDGSIYPQISVIQGATSFSIWDGQMRKGTSGLRLLKMTELDEQESIQIKTVLKIFGDALVIMSKENPRNQTFQDCLRFFRFNKSREQGQEMSR